MNRLEIEPTPLAGLVLARPRVHRDARGSVRELFRATDFADAGLMADIAQVNLLRSAAGVVRGLHFQWEPPLAKCMRVARGRALLVAVDIRRGSATCGQAWWREAVPDDDFWVCAPAGFARGLQALEDGTDVEYLCSAAYTPAGEGGIRWDDPALGIPWPLPARDISPKDAAAPTLAEWLAGPQGGVFAR